MIIDSSKVEELKKEYNIALVKNLKTFRFEGHILDVKYAKYLIEYLEVRV